ncbi:MAG: hypothetical protein AAFX87_11810 [Bacteroidota bacterium]
MSSEFEKYFQSQTDYFWQWEEYGEVLAIPNGSTIAYRDFVLQTLENLANDGIPLFGSLLLVIIATNQSMEDMIASVDDILEKRIDKYTKGHSEPFHSALTLLRKIAELPAMYKTGDRRIQLFQAVFEGAHNKLSKRKAERIINEFSKFDNPQSLMAKQSFNYMYCYNDFRVLDLQNNKFPTKEAIIEKIALIPELDTSVALEEDEEIREGEAPSFVEELVANPATFQIGSLIKHIWSGLRVPHHLAIPSQQPLGGIADLTNKGDLDKLLVSEFANDDIIFLSRLANNEALYLHREAPPATDDFQRIILIDVSIKNWGTPKVLAYAVLLAIAHHPKTDISCITFAVGETYYPIRFDDIDQLIESLQVLDGSLESSLGLERFLKEYSSAKNTEIFFISSEETIKFPAMQKILNEYHAFFKYWVNVDADGNIALYKNQYKTKRLIQNIHLPLEELWSKKPKFKPKKKETKLPAKCPILYPKSHAYKRILHIGGLEYIFVTNEKKIFKRANGSSLHDRKGVEYVTTLPFWYSKYQIGHNEEGQLILLGFRPQDREVITLNLNTLDRQQAPFPEWGFSPLEEFLFYEGAFYFMNYSLHWMIEYEPELKVTARGKTPDYLIEAYRKYEKELKNSRLDGNYPLGGFLKNIKDVYINSVGNLVFNGIHELLLNQHGVLKIEKTQFLKREVLSERNALLDEFTFPDGSKIINERSGMLKLVSSHPEVDQVYLPTVIDAFLCASTAQVFAGNDYYLPNDTDSKLKMMDMRPFYKKYIERFIEHIRLNAATN